MLSAVDGTKQRSFTVAVAIDQVRLIRFKSRVGMIGSVYSIELIRRIVDMDSDARKMEQLLVIGARSNQYYRDNECQHEFAVRVRRERDARVGEGKFARYSMCQGSKCGKHDCKYSRYEGKRREHQHQRQSCCWPERYCCTGGISRLGYFAAGRGVPGTSRVDAVRTAEALASRMPANEGVRVESALTSACGARALRGIASRRMRGRALRLAERAECWPLKVSE